MVFIVGFLVMLLRFHVLICIVHNDLQMDIHFIMDAYIYIRLLNFVSVRMHCTYFHLLMKSFFPISGGQQAK